MSTPVDNSALPNPPSGPGRGPGSIPGHKAAHSAWFYAWSAVGGLLLLLTAVVAGLLLYASTPHFANVVRKKVIATLESSTGGRVELQSFHWNLLHLSVEADNLTIHGLEGPGEAPYAHIDRLYVRARVLAFFGPKIGLNYLEADRPSFHLIVYPDGATNQPRPQERKSQGVSLDTIFNLEIQRAEVHDGLARINQRTIPFDFAARDLGVVVTYAPSTGHYLGHMQVADLDLKRGVGPALQSKLAVEIELAPNAATIKALHFLSGGSQMDASGSLMNFADPHWKLATRGSIDLGEIAALTGVSGLRRGTAELNLQGEGVKTAQFSISGEAHLANGGYQTGYLVINGVNATTRLRITPEEIALDDLHARLREGGSLDAVVRFLHWQTSAAGAETKAEPRAASPLRQQGGRPSARARGKSRRDEPVASIRARVRGIRLPTVLRMIASRRYQDLGFDTAINGAVNVDWTGSGANFTAAAKLQLAAPPSLAPGRLPVSGSVDATYFERGGAVQIRRFEGHTPSTGIDVSGRLAVYLVTGSSALQVHLETGNLGEFDHVLTDLGLSANGKKGVAAIPIQLHGEAEFTGAVTRSLVDPDVKGHLTATNFSTVFSPPGSVLALPATGKASAIPAALTAHALHRSMEPNQPAARTIHWDRLDATGEYSSSRIAIQHATLIGGGARIEAQGEIEAQEEPKPRARRTGFRQPTLNGSSSIRATASIHQASLTDLMAIAGESVPVTGTVDFQVHAGGTLGSLTGGGNFSVRDGEIAGEPYHNIAAAWSFSGHQLSLEKLTLFMNGGTAVANGSYDFGTKAFLANLDAKSFELAHFHRLQSAGIPVAGSLKFDAHASGTLESPSILIGVHLEKLVVRGQPAGGVEGFVHTQGDAASFTAHSTLASARFELSGRTVLKGDFDTQAKLVFANLDVDPFCKAFDVRNLAGRSIIGGTVNVAGPAKEPKLFNGDAEIDQFSVTRENITIRNQGPLLASVKDGVIHLTQAHITGPDTNMTIIGSAGLTGERALDMKGSGSTNMKLAQIFDPDISSSGHVDFNIAADSTLRRPAFTGRVRLTNVALALNDIPTGISNLNGTLVFDQNRLEVENLVGKTGGGQIKLSGFITYQQGIYGDLTATGKGIRVRYSGISATADTTLHLQGSQTNMLLSGNVQITRFLIGPNIDFAVFTGPAAASVPPNPNAPSNHVRLDIHITSSPQLDFQNSYAQLAGSVDLRIRGTVAQPSLLGRISITEGTANFAGTSYQLQRGNIYFTNPVHIEPIIDIDATTRVEEYDLTVGLHGSASHPSPTFRSDPPLPQADVISLLALGRTQQEQLLYSQQQQQAGVDTTTNALLGSALNATVSSRVQKLFGFGSVKIDPTYLGNLGNSTARITVQQNISRTVQLTYARNVNTTAEQLIQAQVNLTRNTSLLAVLDESDVFSLVFKVHKRLR